MIIVSYDYVTEYSKNTLILRKYMLKYSGVNGHDVYN